MWKRPAILMFTKSLNRLEHHTWHYFSKTNNAAHIMWITQFSSTRGLSNEIKMKSKLLPFSLIPVWCWCTFCFWFLNLPSLSKCWYIYIYMHANINSMTRPFGVIHNPISGTVSVNWRKCYWSVWQGMHFLDSLKWRYIFLPDTGS